MTITQIQHPPATQTLDGSPDVEALAATINVSSIASILEFGADVVNKTNDLTEQVLSKAQASDLGETGEQLTKIVVTAQEFDFDALGNSWARLPILGGLLRHLNSSRAKAFARFENVKSQVDRLVSSVEKTATVLTTRDREYSSIYENVRNEYELLGLYVEAIRLKLSQLEAELATPDPAADMASIEHRAVLEASQNALRKRADDLEVIRHSTLQSLPMIRIIQSNNYALVDKFTTIRTLTLPAWKRAFMMALSIAEQKQATDLANNIDNTTNDLLRRNSELLKQNSIEIAKSSQRLVIDIETLKEVHGNIVTTLQEVRAVHAEGAQARSSAVKELATLRAELVQAVNSTARTAA